MNVVRRRRFVLLLLMLTGGFIATSLVLYALRQNINLFFTPSELKNTPVPMNSYIRLGGMVVKGSVKRKKKLQIKFELSDFKAKTTVKFRGILPDLFREGQGIVAEGRLDKKGVFIASTVLAKHDANYMPPKLAAMTTIKKAKYAS